MNALSSAGETENQGKKHPLSAINAFHSQAIEKHDFCQSAVISAGFSKDFPIIERVKLNARRLGVVASETRNDVNHGKLITAQQ